MQQILSPVTYVSLEKEAKSYSMFPACCALFIALANYSVSHQRSQRNFSLFLLDSYGIAVAANKSLLRKCDCYHHKTFTRINPLNSLFRSSHC